MAKRFLIAACVALLAGCSSTLSTEGSILWTHSNSPAEVTAASITDDAILVADSDSVVVLNKDGETRWTASKGTALLPVDFEDEKKEADELLGANDDLVIAKDGDSWSLIVSYSRETNGGDIEYGVAALSGTDGTTQTINADLVVDATGRSGRMQTWLKEHGYQAAQEERIECDVTYVSHFVRMPADALDGDLMLLVGAKPELPHLLGVTRLEDDRWSVTIAAMAGIRPPTDEQGFLDFLDTMPVPDAAKPIREAEPLSDIVVHRFPYSLRRRYERLRQAPEGLIALGDAICSFNPIYGQGMTVAAMEALALRDCLATSDTDVSRRYFKAASRLIDSPWQLAAGGDLGIPAVKGRRTPMVRAMNAYIARLHKAAATDPEVTVAFLRVIGFLEHPSALFAPRILSRALFRKAAA